MTTRLELEHLLWKARKERDEALEQVYKLENELHTANARLKELEHIRARAYDRYISDPERDN